MAQVSLMGNLSRGGHKQNIWGFAWRHCALTKRPFYYPQPNKESLCSSQTIPAFSRSEGSEACSRLSLLHPSVTTRLFVSLWNVLIRWRQQSVQTTFKHEELCSLFKTLFMFAQFLCLLTDKTSSPRSLINRAASLRAHLKTQLLNR